MLFRGVKIGSAVSQKDRQAAHTGLLRETISKMVISTEGARRLQKAGAETNGLLPGVTHSSSLTPLPPSLTPRQKAMDLKNLP